MNPPMNSKLRDILMDFRRKTLDFDPSKPENSNQIELAEAEKAIRQAVGEEMLEDVIGQDLNSNLFDVDSPYYILRASYQFAINGYKAELRQKIKQWQGGEGE